MAMQNHIRNPIEWAWDSLKHTGHAAETATQALGGAMDVNHGAPATIRTIGTADLREALRQGLRDFEACRTDVIFLCLIYPIVGIVLSRLAYGHGMLPLIFPLASGFALMGPVFAVGLYELSRRRERGLTVTWGDVFGVARAPAFGSILMLGGVLLAIFIAWEASAYVIYELTLGPEPPVSIEAFLHDVFTTPAGWTMMAAGMGVGFLFALLVLVISVVSFPMLLDRNAGIYTAVSTSVRAVLANPRAMATWGLIVALGLLLGALPLLVGLAIVMPVLGHATWHLYRKVLPA